MGEWLLAVVVVLAAGIVGFCAYFWRRTQILWFFFRGDV